MQLKTTVFQPEMLLSLLLGNVYDEGVDDDNDDDDAQNGNNGNGS